MAVVVNTEHASSKKKDCRKIWHASLNTSKCNADNAQLIKTIRRSGRQVSAAIFLAKYIKI